MQKLEEKMLIGKWKSFKTFKHSGEIRLHTTSLYKEFDIATDRTLTIKEHIKDKEEIILVTNQWTLDFNNKKHYLKIPQNKLTFEIITVNHTVLVLLNYTTSEKIFLSKEDSWRDHLQSNKEMVL